MVIIGINAFHGDSSACLIVDGKLIAAAEEERFIRIKHWAGFPSESIKYCLKVAGLKLSDVNFIAINQNPVSNLTRKFLYTITHFPSYKLILDRLKNRKKRISIENKLRIDFPNDFFQGKVEYVDHHLAHLASAHYVSPFTNSVVVSVDGFGDFASTAWGLGQGNNLNVDERIYFPHSLGIFYMAITQFLGFTTWGDEYKVMGLAPYGKPRYLDEMRNIIKLSNDGKFKLNLKYFLHHRERTEVEWNGAEPKVGNLFSSELEKLLGPQRKKGEELTTYHYDLARSAQAMYEEAFFHLLNYLHTHYSKDNLTLAGGCAMNSVANGKIYQNTPFKQVYIQAAAGDAGGAIGAANVVLFRNKEASRFQMNNAYWGPQYSDLDIEVLLNQEVIRIKQAGCEIRLIQDDDNLTGEVAKAIADGLVVGWFYGRMEWGPRALGNRSILGDPRRSDMKDILNIKIKRRESFRPFAPSILRENVKEWFEVDDDVPFMMQVYQIREEKRSFIPAVTHVDGSGRLQTVTTVTNSRYYKLISKFKEITGVPIVLNTSFNENEPIVCNPKEALDCFLRTKMDVLVMQNWILRRS